MVENVWLRFLVSDFKLFSFFLLCLLYECFVCCAACLAGSRPCFMARMSREGYSGQVDSQAGEQRADLGREVVTDDSVTAGKRKGMEDVGGQSGERSMKQPAT